jgi:hypothetical protein
LLNFTIINDKNFSNYQSELVISIISEMIGIKFNYEPVLPTIEYKYNVNFKVLIYRFTYTNIDGKVFEFTPKQIITYCNKYVGDVVGLILGCLLGKKLGCILGKIVGKAVSVNKVEASDALNALRYNRNSSILPMKYGSPKLLLPMKLCQIMKLMQL